MRIPPPPTPVPPDAMRRIADRIAEIKARFRPEGGAFADLLSRASAAGSGHARRAIASAAARHGVDPSLLTALAEVESGLRPRATSSAGALGLMQIMPGTARGLGLHDPFDSATNADAGARYLRQQLDRFGGDVALALAAYNAGPAAVLRHGGMPPYEETRHFVSRVLSRLEEPPPGEVEE